MKSSLNPTLGDEEILNFPQIFNDDSIHNLWVMKLRLKLIYDANRTEFIHF